MTFLDWIKSTPTLMVAGGIAGYTAGKQHYLKINNEVVYTTLGGVLAGAITGYFINRNTAPAPVAALTPVTQSVNTPAPAIPASTTSAPTATIPTSTPVTIPGPAPTGVTVEKVPASMTTEESEPLQPETPDDIIGASISNRSMLSFDDEEISGEDYEA